MRQAKGPSIITRYVAAILILVALALLAYAPSAATAAAPPLLVQFGENCGVSSKIQAGECSDAGETNVPRGIATDPTTGDVYVADQGNSRVDKFSPWGGFLEAWGWGVRDGSPELQTCGPAATPPSANCQRGLEGGGPGEFQGEVQGIALDSGANVYVVDRNSHRVQKFDSEGNFVLMFGGDVNRTKAEELGSAESERNLCTAASGDVCQVGTTGVGNGQFERWPVSGFIAVNPDDRIYVGDKERVQEFDTNGKYLGNLPDPKGLLVGKGVRSLAVSPAGAPNEGDLYLSFAEDDFASPEPHIFGLSPAGATLATLELPYPSALAVDSTGNVYVFKAAHQNNGNADVVAEVVEFNSIGGKILSFGDGDLERSTGIATSSACGIEGVDLFVSNAVQLNSRIRAYGPPPDPAICPPPSVPPAINDQYATSVDSVGATLKAAINPHFWPDTTYYVQYGTSRCSEGGCDQEKPLAPGSELTTAVTSQDIATAGVFLGGLQPDTTYHYRFVAQSSGGGPVRGVGGQVGNDGAEGAFHTFSLAPEARTDCPNQALRTEASAKLPNCRAYEMVSPVDKNGGDVAMEGARIAWGTLAESSAKGQRLTFSSLRSFGDPQSAPLVNQYLSVRGDAGWSARSISPPRVNPAFYEPGRFGYFKGFSEDLCSAWVVQDSPMALAPGAPVGFPNLYRRDNCGAQPSYELLTSLAPPEFPEFESPGNQYAPAPRGASADSAHSVFRANAKLTSNACATAGIYQVYESSEEGQLRLVSILPNGKATCTHAEVGEARGSVHGFEDSVHHAVSADGSRVFWTDSGDSHPQFPGFGEGFTGGAGKLYVRLNATQPSGKAGNGCSEAEKACTLAISASPATFIGADTQGTRAIYTVGQELLQFDVEADQSHLIAEGVEGVVGESDDLSRIYFVSQVALSGDQENNEGDKAVAGESNLYLAEGGTSTFIATLGSSESELAAASQLANSTLTPLNRTSRVSADGLHLAFTSTEPITGYDNTDLASQEPDSEIYLYAAVPGGVGNLTCISCNPSGARPSGREVAAISNGHVRLWAASQLPGWAEQLRPTRLLSDDGDRLFFESFDALVLADTNGAQDVYEWERAADAKACRQAGAQLYVESSGGCLSLISSGHNPEESELVDVSDSGGDVFFATEASLLQQDLGLVDVYDARVNGGYPPPQVPKPSCEGEACQGPLAAPNDPTPASSSFEGTGNVVESKAHHKNKKARKKKSHRRAKHRANQKKRTAR